MVSDPACADLLRRAAPLLDGLEVFPYRGAGEEAQADADDHVVLVHDLMPDPSVQLDWLHRLHQRVPGFEFLLLLPPRSGVVRELALRGSRLPLAGVELWTPELTPKIFAGRLRSTLAGRAGELRLWERITGWALPSVLRFLAEAELRFASPDAPLDEVLRLAGVGYESARRQAAKADLPPPKRFVEALRLLRAVSSLERGEKVKRTAPAYSFHNAERFARRMRYHFGMTPTEARTIGAIALLRRLEREWFGDGGTD